MGLLILGKDFIFPVITMQPIDSTFVAPAPDLILLRAIRIKKRADGQEVDDFTDLMSQRRAIWTFERGRDRWRGFPW